jgi:hypothetical protein
MTTVQRREEEAPKERNVIAPGVSPGSQATQKICEPSKRATEILVGIQFCQPSGAQWSFSDGESGLTPGASAPESASSQRGGSPLQVNALRPVTECDCDAAMRGGEQQEVNDQSVG